VLVPRHSGVCIELIDEQQGGRSHRLSLSAPVGNVRVMLARIDLTLDCSNAAVLAEFWKAAAGYVDEPPPAPFNSREEWLAQYDEEDGTRAAARGYTILRESRRA